MHVGGAERAHCRVPVIVKIRYFGKRKLFMIFAEFLDPISKRDEGLMDRGDKADKESGEGSRAAPSLSQGPWLSTDVSH